MKILNLFYPSLLDLLFLSNSKVNDVWSSRLHFFDVGTGFQFSTFIVVRRFFTFYLLHSIDSTLVMIKSGILLNAVSSAELWWIGNGMPRWCHIWLSWKSTSAWRFINVLINFMVFFLMASITFFHVFLLSWFLFFLTHFIVIWL